MMNHEPESGFSPKDAPAFRRLRDRRLARRRRVLRIVLLVTLSAALLAGAAFYAHRQLVKPHHRARDHRDACGAADAR